MSLLDYDDHSLLAIFEVVEKVIKPIYAHYPWGYSISYYISGLKCCHPNYASYLIVNSSLLFTNIYNIIYEISIEKLEVYNESLIQKLCKSYLVYHM